MSLSKTSLPFLLAACMAGCTMDSPEPMGRLGVALTTVADGTTYRLGSGTQLLAHCGDFNENYPLDGDEASVLIDVPAGECQLALYHPYGWTTDWPLERVEDDGSFTSIFGTLLTPMPVLLSIVEGVTTSVVLEFRVAESGTITFGYGTVAVTAEVDVVDATDASFGLNGNAIEVLEAEVDANAPAELEGYWPVAGDAGIGVNIVGPAGDWTVRSSSRVCAPVEVGVSNILGSAAFDDLVEESRPIAPNAADLCIFNLGDVQVLELYMTRQGAPITPAFIDLGAGEYRFTSSFRATLSEPVYDGETLDLGALDWQTPNLFMEGTLEVQEVTESGLVPWYHSLFGGSATLYFAPSVQ